jgi:hypothetical protein
VPKVPKIKPYAVERVSGKFGKSPNAKTCQKSEWKNETTPSGTGGAPEATGAIGNQETAGFEILVTIAPIAKDFCAERVTRKFWKNAKSQ